MRFGVSSAALFSLAPLFPFKIFFFVFNIQTLVLFSAISLTLARALYSSDRGSGIFKTAAIYVLRKEKRLLTTGQITRYCVDFERKKREKSFSFFFSFRHRMAHIFFPTERRRARRRFAIFF
jgi:hypothetical protein